MAAENNVSDRAIVLTRVFNAPRALVFSAFTDAEHIGKWWGPNGFTTTTESIDIRPGGEWRFVMHGPDGTDYPTRIVYRLIESPDRLVYVHLDEAGNEVFETTATFADHKGRTHLTFRLLLPSKEARDFVVREHRAIEGGEQTLAKLAEHVEYQPVHVDASDRELITTRLFNAPRSLVYQAWSDPEHLVKWWGPNGFTTTIQEMDLRPGGVWSLTMHGPDGTNYPNRSIFGEVVAGERITYSHSGARKGGPAARFEAMVTFGDEADGKTRVTLRMVFPSAADRDAVIQAYGAAEGAKQTLNRLAEELERMRSVAA